MELPFSSSGDSRRPLADRMRPSRLDEFVGQDDLIGPGTLLRKSLEKGVLSQSLILWGPPGCGKTTLAKIIAGAVKGRFVVFSAVTSKISDVKRVIAEAGKLLSVEKTPFILFIDELHRFNKAQQDAFLPHIENGTIIFIGATTENPSFEVIGPLLSRSRVLVLGGLSRDDILKILRRALADKDKGLGTSGLDVPDDILDYVADLSQGDARVALNALEYGASVLVKDQAGGRFTKKLAEDALQRRLISTDKDGESHFNLISALHKSLRGGDADSSLYWLARMCEAGEDPLYIARRLVRFASEDIGNADPRALSICIAAKEAVSFLGYPECKLSLAQAVLYMALAPKSNAVYTAYGAASALVSANPPYPVPLHIRNAPTSLMKELGYGKGYLYPHDSPDSAISQEYFPRELSGTRLYFPNASGFENELKNSLENYLEKRKRDKKK